MLTDPQTLTVNAVAKTLARVEQTGSRANYATQDELFSLVVSHQRSGQKTESLMKYTQKAVVSDPLTAVNDFQELGIQIKFTRPDFGFSQTQVEQLWAAIKAHIDNTMIGKIYGRES